MVTHSLVRLQNRRRDFDGASCDTGMSWERPNRIGMHCPDDDKTRTVDVPLGYWNVIEHQLRSFSRPLTTEPTLKFPFNNAIQNPHNTAIQGASDAHAEIWAEGSKLATQPIGNADFIMVYDGKLTGIIELKTWWKVTPTEIEDVRAGPLHPPLF